MMNVVIPNEERNLRGCHSERREESALVMLNLIQHLLRFRNKFGMTGIIKPAMTKKRLFFNLKAAFFCRILTILATIYAILTTI
jgi:hypothetical protein